MFVRTLWLLFAACLIGPALLGNDRFSAIVITNETRDFKVFPTIEFFEGKTEKFTETSPDKFEYQFRVAEKKWFNTADIKLVWKDAYQNNDGTKSDFAQRVKLRIRYNFPKEFIVRAYFSNNRSQKEMEHLEYLKDENEQWEKFFRAWQIAGYYRASNGPQYPLSKRASLIFFDAADQLAETSPYLVKMSDEAITFGEEAFQGKRDLSKVINRAKSAYWEDLRKIKDLMKDHDCAAARLLLDDLQEQMDTESDLFALRYPKRPHELEEAKKYVDAKCPQP